MIEKAKETILNYKGAPLRIMEVCGTHTHEIFRLGIRSLLPPQVNLISGPGCPVCVTAVDYIDKAIYLAKKGCCICTFGDLIRVPGSDTSLAGARAEGGEIKTVYAPSDAVKYAQENPDKQVVFLAVGFETTVPAVCLAVEEARRKNIENFSILAAHKTMPAAYQALKGSADVFIYPGHVNAITGNAVCQRLREEGVSGVVAGFTPQELLMAFSVILTLYPKGEPFFKNCYTSVVKEEGNIPAQKLINKVMEPCDSLWRGLGIIKNSGLKLREEYALYDAEKKYSVPDIKGTPNPACKCADILMGKCKPPQCPLFGKACTPLKPVGACMVSGEGACSAYYQYGEKI
ncbi:MAG: hydrogenase formation protein HypD [Firmicutes bacterium]|nr:hydrogenase formation protein HypD [Bacillota bacterium]